MWFSWHLVLILETIRQARTGVIVARLQLCQPHLELIQLFTCSLWLVDFYAFLQILCFLNCDLRTLLGFSVSEATFADNAKQAKIFSHAAAAAVKSQPDLYLLLLSSRRYHT